MGVQNVSSRRRASRGYFQGVLPGGGETGFVLTPLPVPGTDGSDGRIAVLGRGNEGLLAAAGVAAARRGGLPAAAISGPKADGDRRPPSAAAASRGATQGLAYGAGDGAATRLRLTGFTGGHISPSAVNDGDRNRSGIAVSARVKEITLPLDLRTGSAAVVRASRDELLGGAPVLEGGAAAPTPTVVLQDLSREEGPASSLEATDLLGVRRTWWRILLWSRPGLLHQQARRSWFSG